MSEIRVTDETEEPNGMVTVTLLEDGQEQISLEILPELLPDTSSPEDLRGIIDGIDRGLEILEQTEVEEL